MKCPNCGELLGFATTVCLSCNANIRGQTASGSEKERPGEKHHKNLATDEPERSWITLVSCQDIGETNALVAWLESNGIEANLPDKALMRTPARNRRPDAMFRVQVSPDDSDAAQRYLAVFQQGPPDFDEPDDEGTAPPRQQPLSWLMRWCAFAMPLLVCGAFFAYPIARSGYTGYGRERQARELRNWFVAGIIFWGAAVIVFLTVWD